MNRKHHFLLSFTLILVAAVAARADDIDDYVKRVMQSQHIPAVSIAVIKDGSLIKAEGYGLADLEHGIPARPDDRVSAFDGRESSRHLRTVGRRQSVSVRRLQSRAHRQPTYADSLADDQLWQQVNVANLSCSDFDIGTVLIFGNSGTGMSPEFGIQPFRKRSASCRSWSAYG